METAMHYKTIVLELLKERQEIHNELQRARKLLPTLERYARDLKTRHEAWKERLFKTKPASDPNQIASEALEIALKELEDFLDSASHPEEGPSLDRATVPSRGGTPRT
jgi:hypothetical protein